MLLLPSPKKLMLGYLAGALLTSITLGIVIVRTLEDSGAVSTAKHQVNPFVDLALGAILLVVAFVLATDHDRRVREARARRKARSEPKTPRWQQWLGRGNPKITFAVGVVLTFPGASYLAALTSLARLNYGCGRRRPGGGADQCGDDAAARGAADLLRAGAGLDPDGDRPREDGAATHGRRILLTGLTVIGSLLILRGVITLLA